MKKYTVKDTFFINENGERVILKGINMVCKDKGRGYIGDYSEEDFAYLSSLGFNIVRFGIFWDGVEPERGIYNDEYLKKIKELSKIAEKYGIALYLDMHQDLFSAKFCDGAPAWATITNGEAYEKTELWSEAYLTSAAVQLAFDNFWNNTDGIQDAFVAMWKHILEFFKDDSNIIGIDPFNEPFPGTCSNALIETLFTNLAIHLSCNPELLFEILGEEAVSVNDDNIGEIIMGIWMDENKKSVLLSGFNDADLYKSLVYPLSETVKEFDNKILTGFYKRMRDAIRSVDKDTLLFIEANYFCNTGVMSNVIPPKDETGVQDLGLVYSPHGYDLMVDTASYNSDCFTRLDVIFDTHKEYAEKYNLPVLVGEWGCYPEGTVQQLKEASYLLNKFKKLDFSNTYYDFSTIKDNPVTRVLSE